MTSKETFTVGWICARQEVYEAACAMLDEDLLGPELAEQNDSNTYFFGRIGKHRIVIGCLPSGRRSTGLATRLAKDMTWSFPQLRFLLMVGTAGGAPTEEHDIRLGDVVVSQPNKASGGVIQYDMAWQNDIFDLVWYRHLNSPPPILLSALPEVKRRHNNPTRYGGIDQHLKLLSEDSRFQRPENDLLFAMDTDIEHRTGLSNCRNCDKSGLVIRQPRNSRRAIDVFYGCVASGNSVIRDAKQRHIYADDETKVLCFETEAAGLMNDFPCIAIRGISNYADAHKNNEWNYYAAATAAAYAKELLCVVKPIKAKPLLTDTMIAEIAANLRRGINTEVIIDRAGLTDLLPRPRASEMLCNAESSQGSETTVGSINSSESTIPTVIW
ncbi:purine and uridine phosphorylase [Trichoderma evansii]